MSKKFDQTLLAIQAGSEVLLGHVETERKIGSVNPIWDPEVFREVYCCDCAYTLGFFRSGVRTGGVEVLCPKCRTKNSVQCQHLENEGPNVVIDAVIAERLTYAGANQGVTFASTRARKEFLETSLKIPGK